MTKDNSLIYNKIAGSIITMKLLPGQKLGEIEMASKYKVSRTPIRDVFKKLEYNGLVEIHSQSGTYVTKIDMANISDLIYVRNCVEVNVLSSVAGKLSSLDKTYLKDNLKMQRCLNEKKKDSSDDSFAAALFELDNQFHGYIYQMAAKQGVLRILNGNQPNFQRYRFMTFLRDESQLNSLYDIHEKMLNCIIDNDVSSLIEIVYEHNYAGLHGIDKVIQKHPEYFENLEY